MFECDKCGACCMNLENSHIYDELDRGDGVCKFFNMETKLCTIYDERPLMCNVDKAFETFFKESMTKGEYYELNYNACKKLKNNMGNRRDNYVFKNAE